MVVKGNINEVCKQLHALKKAFVENNVSLFEYIRIRKAQQFYEEDRDIITSDDECSRCPHQVHCCGQCGGNYEED